MTEALYERYKDALRRGHVAALRGRPEDALTAYGEAARLAPDRSLPLIGVGTVLATLGKHGEALTAFDAALERAPRDEAALRGRADALAAGGDAVAAAATLDELASVLDAADRPADAMDAARRALELAESRSRRATVRSMTEQLTAEPSDPTMAEALERALAVLEARVSSRRPAAVTPTAPEPPGEAEAAQAGPEPEPEPEPDTATAPVRSGRGVRRRRGRGRGRRPGRDPRPRADRDGGAPGRRPAARGDRCLLRRARHQSRGPGPAPRPGGAVPRPWLAGHGGRQAGAPCAARRADRRSRHARNGLRRGRRTAAGRVPPDGHLHVVRPGPGKAAGTGRDATLAGRCRSSSDRSSTRSV